MDTKELARTVVQTVKDYVSVVLRPLEQRLEKAEAFRDDIDSLLNEKVAAIPLQKGEDGKSVTIEEITPILKELVAELPKPENGKDGRDGKPGEQGERGEQGEKGDAGESGKDGLDGKDGADGRDGKDGLDGRDGRDALDIEILPLINPEKVYPRGTFATHKGGLWKAHSNTSGMKGWECIVNGVADVEVSYDEERSFEIKILKTAGEAEIKKFVMPIVIDKGVYKKDFAYSKNDGVTYGGSYWLAQKDNPEGVPGASKDFRLAVKRGRDGKETVKTVPLKAVKLGGGSNG